MCHVIISLTHQFIGLTHELVSRCCSGRLLLLLPSLLLLPLLFQYAFNGFKTRGHELVPSIHSQSSAKAPI
jgi:hypothetical protein